MVSMKFKGTWKTVLLLALGIIAFLIYLYVFNVDIPTIIAIVGNADLRLYLLALVFVIFDTMFFSLAWHTLLNFLSVKISVLRSFLYVWYGMFIDIIIPAESVSAEISKLYLVTREQNGTSGKVVASLVIQRLIGMSLNIIGLLIGASLLITQMQISGLVLNLTLFLAATSMVFLILLILFCAKEAWTLKIISKIMNFVEYISKGRWKPAKIQAEIFKAAKIFHDSMRAFRRSPKLIFTSLFFSVVAWLLSISVIYVVFVSIGFTVDWGVIIITHSIISAIHGIPFGIPFEAGLPEITMTALYGVLGVPLNISATATILTRILTVWLRFFIGFVVQQGLEIKVMTAMKTSNQVDKT
ncbi:flippase-like domain-containing protein [Candidatus Bathyarchaeota archaeon]|nr:flippase-like domain-containing protein [Candidatus Bathyarchaeota archaeon]